MTAPDKMWRETISPNQMYKEGGSFYHETKPEREGLVEYTRSDLIQPASPLGEVTLAAAAELPEVMALREYFEASDDMYRTGLLYATYAQSERLDAARTSARALAPFARKGE